MKKQFPKRNFGVYKSMNCSKKKHKKQIKRENRILEVVQKYKDIITLDNIQQYLGELVKASKHKL